MGLSTANVAHHPLLPKDRDSLPIQVLSVQEDTVVEAPIAAGNNRVALPAESEIVEVSASDTCKFAFGNSSVDVTVGVKRVFPLGSAVYKVPPGATHIAVTQYNGSTGVVTVARMF
jgi:hypothetical protein